MLLDVIKCCCDTVLQCLVRCRDEVCAELGLQVSDVELSMGMSGDFEQAVSCNFTHRSAPIPYVDL